MTIFRFDGTFDGILSCVFNAYELKRFPDMILREDAAAPLFYDECVDIATDEEKSRRVWKAVRKKLSSTAASAVVTSFLCEIPEFDMVIFNYIRKTVDSPRSIEGDFGDPDVMEMTRMVKRVNYEAHRLLQFMRFQKTADGTYFAIMEPLYNVMPLAVNHFVDRFSTMKFVLYDKRRGFGFYYDGNEATRITLPEELPHIAHGHLSEDIMSSDEKLFQDLWRTYFKAIAIKERTNPRKQRQDMPVRFWKYMTEKNG